jgi:hypothetical protein
VYRTFLISKTPENSPSAAHQLAGDPGKVLIHPTETLPGGAIPDFVIRF